MAAMRAIASLLLLLTVAACGGSDGPPPHDYIDMPQFENEYVIGYGETLNLADNVSLNFTMVEEDSRCPTGAQCISQGNARILVTTFTPRGNGSVELNTNPEFATSSLFDYYGVALRKLEPYPSVGAQMGAGGIPVSAYEATVFVIKAGQPP
jgi:hypothetical protein